MNKTANYQLTIIVPVYNEEGNILRLEKELGEFLKDAKVASFPSGLIVLSIYTDKFFSQFFSNHLNDLI